MAGVRRIDRDARLERATSVLQPPPAALQSSAVSEAGAVAGGDSSEILMVPRVHPFTTVPGRADPPGHKTEAEQEMHPGCSRLRPK